MESLEQYQFMGVEKLAHGFKLCLFKVFNRKLQLEVSFLFSVHLVVRCHQLKKGPNSWELLHAFLWALGLDALLERMSRPPQLTANVKTTPTYSQHQDHPILQPTSRPPQPAVFEQTRFPVTGSKEADSNYEAIEQNWYRQNSHHVLTMKPNHWKSIIKTFLSLS